MAKKSTKKQSKPNKECEDEQLVWLGKRISDLHDDQRDLNDQLNDLKMEYDYSDKKEMNMEEQARVSKEIDSDQKEIDELSDKIEKCGKDVDDVVNEALDVYQDLEEIEEEEERKWEEMNPPLPDKPESDRERYFRNFGTYEGY